MRSSVKCLFLKIHHWFCSHRLTEIIRLNYFIDKGLCVNEMNRTPTPCEQTHYLPPTFATSQHVTCYCAPDEQTYELLFLTYHRVHTSIHVSVWAKILYITRIHTRYHFWLTTCVACESAYGLPSCSLWAKILCITRIHTTNHFWLIATFIQPIIFDLSPCCLCRVDDYGCQEQEGPKFRRGVWGLVVREIVFVSSEYGYSVWVHVCKICVHGSVHLSVCYIENVCGGWFACQECAQLFVISRIMRELLPWHNAWGVLFRSRISPITVTRHACILLTHMLHIASFVCAGFVRKSERWAAILLTHSLTH